MSQVAVVGEQQQALGVGVEPADVEQSLTGGDPLGDDVADARATRSSDIVDCQPRGLFSAMWTSSFLHDDTNAVDADHRVLGVNPQTLLDARCGRRPRRDPASISSSAARREATPAWASTFCRRMPSPYGSFVGPR